MAQKTLDGRKLGRQPVPERLQEEDLAPEDRVLKRYTQNYEPLTGAE